jgi:hypothetical protein
MLTKATDRRARFAARAIAALTLAGAIGVGANAPAGADDVPLESRRYRIHLLQIRALDETGPFNSFLSDEIYAGFLTKFGGGEAHVQSGMFGDFDAGETRRPPANQACVAPVFATVNNGDPEMVSGFERDEWGCVVTNAPFEIRARLWESDFAIGPCDFPLGCRFNPDPLGMPSLLQRAEDDDPVGDTTISFSRQGLANDLLVPGAARDYNVEHHGSQGHYRVTYRVTRTN